MTRSILKALAMAAALPAIALAGCLASGGDTAAGDDPAATGSALVVTDAPKTTVFVEPSPVPEFDDPILAVAVEDAPPLDPRPEWIIEFPPDLGEPVGHIRIDKAGVDWPVIAGVQPEHLNVSPGHMPRTAMPGQFGNAVIAGHRTTYGAPFYNLDLLEPGDEIEVDTAIGTHTYAVVSTEIVLPTAMWTVQHRAGGWLTLIACHPKGSAAQRIIVFARLIDGPNLDYIDAAFDGEYLPPKDPGAGVRARNHPSLVFEPRIR